MTAYRLTHLLRWQCIILPVIFLAYGVTMWQRKALSFVIPYIDKERLSRDEIGALVSAQNAAYGVSKFFLGVYSDELSPAALFSGGLALSALATALFAFVPSSLLRLLCQVASGFSQGGAWPATVKIITNWWHTQHLGTLWSLLSAASNMTSTIVPLLLPSFITRELNDGWRTVMIVAGATGLVTALIFRILVVSHPEERHLKSPNDDENATKKKKKETTISLWKLAHDGTLQRLTVLYCVVFTLKTCADNWIAVYLMDEHGLDAARASHYLSLFEGGGLVSSLLTGAVTDALLRVKHRMPFACSPRLFVSILFLLASAISLHYTVIASEHLLLPSAFVLGAAVYGNINIFGVVATESAPTSVSGSSHALVALGAQVGGVVGGYPLAHIAELYSWHTVLSAFSAACVCGAALLIGTIFIPTRIAHDEEKEHEE